MERTFRGHAKLGSVVDLSGLHVAAPGTVWLGGRKGRIALTRDGGREWLQGTSPLNGSLYDAWHEGAEWHAVGTHGAIHSDDGGEVWTRAKTARRKTLVRVTGGPGGRRFGLLQRGSLWVGAASRARWTERKISDRYGGLALHALAATPDAVLVGGMGALLRSEEDGASWGAVEGFPAEGECHGLAARDEVVVAVGGRVTQGSVWTSRDGGRTVQEAELPAGCPLLYDVWLGAPGDAWACGRDGALLRSTDDGSSWSAVELKPAMTLRRLSGLPGGELWVLGQRKLWRGRP